MASPHPYTSPTPATNNTAAAITVYHEIESSTTTQISSVNNTAARTPRRGRRYMQVLIANYVCLFVGSISASLLSKFYFIHKGNSRWVSTWVQSAGFPLLSLPVYLPYYVFNATNRRPFTGFTPKMFLLTVVLGVCLGVNNLLFSWGTSYLPVSTSSLLLSSQLAFTLILSIVIVKQKITFKNLNCVILLTLASVLLALGSNSDKSEGLSKRKYFIGFSSTIGAGLLFAAYLPVMELVYRRVNCYSMVMEMQLIMEMAATLLASVGMAADGGYTAMKSEGSGVFDLGEKAYWCTVWFTVVAWQLCFMSTAGMIFLTTSLTSGICMTAMLSVNVLGGVLVYGDHFGGVKAVSTVLCIWGFSSYVYGMYVRQKEEEKSRAAVNGGGEPVVEMGRLGARTTLAAV